MAIHTGKVGLRVVQSGRGAGAPFKQCMRGFVRAAPAPRRRRGGRGRGGGAVRGAGGLCRRTGGRAGRDIKCAGAKETGYAIIEWERDKTVAPLARRTTVCVINTNTPLFARVQSRPEQKRGGEVETGAHLGHGGVLGMDRRVRFFHGRRAPRGLGGRRRHAHALAGGGQLEQGERGGVGGAGRAVGGAAAEPRQAAVVVVADDADRGEGDKHLGGIEALVAAGTVLRGRGGRAGEGWLAGWLAGEEGS
jgi:hypothetical protein